MKNRILISGIALLLAVFFSSCEDATGGSTIPENYAAKDKFVAIVRGSGKTAWSEDGSLWTEGGELPFKDTESGTMWNAIASGGGKFVAITQNKNKSAWSADGVTWNEGGALPHSGNWQGLTYGRGKFVAVSQYNNQGALSTDGGKTWTAITILSTADSGWNSVAYGSGKFVAVDWSGRRVALSDDGATWTAGADLPTGNWYSIAWGNGKFVALSNTGKAAWSGDDGETWNEADLPFSGQGNIAYGYDRFAAIFGDTESSNKAAYSEDGIDWTQATTLPESKKWCGIAWGNGRFVALADSIKDAAYSADGITWTMVSLPEIPEESSSRWNSVAFMAGY
jgi:hypothetical protein